MSRIGKKAVVVPAGVTAKLSGQAVSIKGPKGELAYVVPEEIEVAFEAGQFTFKPRAETQRAKAMWGLSRTLVGNMVEGVTKGYEKKLKIEGIGYQARMNKKSVVLTVGYANAVEMAPPDGVTVELPDPTTIVIKGADKQKVGQFAAEVRRVRKPEPYKGKGIRYENETVRRKEGKSFASGAS
jgi:large subunit ribosomal protein L6